MHHEDHQTGEKHYICKGDCHGVSDKPGVCHAESCADHGKALHECDCHDKKREEDVIVE